MCDNWRKKKKIYGCGKPYQVINPCRYYVVLRSGVGLKEGDEYKVNICEYI